jgi:tRNA (guanine37-N1)-methyltransferase
MQFDILTLFPDLIHFYAEESILGRAQQKGLISIAAHNFRDDTKDKRKHVDDRL